MPAKAKPNVAKAKPSPSKRGSSTGSNAAPPSKKPKGGKKAAIAKPKLDLSDMTPLNAEYYQKLADCIDGMLEDNHFANIMSASPLKLGEGGIMAPYNDEDFKLAISTTKTYKAGGNLFWVKLMKSAGFHKVPVNSKAVEKLMQHYFETPQALQHNIKVAVKAGEDPMEMRGNLDRISPEEMDHALLFRIHQRMESPDCSSDELDEWRNVLLSVTIEFVEITDTMDRTSM